MKHLPDLYPQITEIPTKGFRQLYLLDDAFAAGIFLLINPTKEQFNAWLKEHFGLEEKDEAEYEAFHNWYRDKTGQIYNVIVFNRPWAWKRIDHGTLIHEIHHAVTNILNRKGIKHGAATEEVWAYYQQGLYERFIWALQNRRRILHRPKAPKKRALAKKRAKK